ASVLNKVGEFVGTPPHVLFVEHALVETSKEARHIAFEHLAAHRQQCGAGGDGLPQWQKVVLVTSRAVQEQDRRLAMDCRRHEPVEMRELCGGDHDGSRRSCAICGPHPWRSQDRGMVVSYAAIAGST